MFISKVDSDRFNLIFAPLSIKDVVFSTVQQHRCAADVSGVAVAVDVDLSSIPPLLLGDSSRIAQIMSNLMSNGALFSARRRRLL